MKRLFIAAILLILGFCVLAKEKPNKHPLMASDTVVWAGLDYSMVRMIGTNDFKVPDAIFPGMLEKWNTCSLMKELKKSQMFLKNACPLILVASRNAT